MNDYIYKAYDKDDDFLGIIPNVVSDFRYTQSINSPAVELTFNIGRSPDVTEDEVNPILDETGDPILDEDGGTIYEIRPETLVGDTSSGQLIANNNIVKVYEVNDDYPDGNLVFEGWITSFEPTFSNNPNIKVTCLSKGSAMADYVITTGDVEEATQENEETSVQGAYWGSAFTQKIEPSGSDISLDKITIKVQARGQTIPINPILCSGDPDLDLLHVISGTASYQFGGSNSSIASFSTITAVSQAPDDPFIEYTATLSSTQTLTDGGEYYILFWFSQGESGNLYIQASTGDAVSPLEKMYYARATINNATTAVDYDAGKRCMWIKLLSSSGNTTSTYNSQDPTDIAIDIIDHYISKGGEVTYTQDTTTEDTSLSVSYTFNLSTILEGIQKCLELSPSNWYWYVDPGSQVFYFKSASTTADHTFIKGRHLTAVSLRVTVDDVKNKVYFSGGDTGAGENLLKVYTNTDGIDLHGRQRLARLSDGRVTVAATAEALSDNILDGNEDEVYHAEIIIPASVYDIDSINVGDMVSFADFNSYVDDLLLQIVRLYRFRDRIELTLGKLPPTQTLTLAQALADINALQTLDNPETPA